MTTNDKTREALRQIKHSITQARNPFNDWRRELRLIENTVDEVITALASTTAQPPVAAVPEVPPEGVVEAMKRAWWESGCSHVMKTTTAYKLYAIVLAATPTPAPAAQDDADAAAAKEADAVEVLTEEGWVWDGDQWQRPPERAEVRPPLLSDGWWMFSLAGKRLEDSYLTNAFNNRAAAVGIVQAAIELNDSYGTPPSAADIAQGQQQGEPQP
jgi:hypothetical protein